MFTFLIWSHAYVGLTYASEIPLGTFTLSTSPSESADTSSIFGGALQYNLKKDGLPFTIGLHGLWQTQQFNNAKNFGDSTPSRWGYGVSVNYYHQIFGEFFSVGVKTLTYSGSTKTQSALDCLYCSDITATYSGGEDYISVGVTIGQWAFQVDKRVSNNGSKWTESANDPYGVGSNYFNSSSRIPDPAFIFHIGAAF